MARKFSDLVPFADVDKAANMLSVIPPVLCL